MSFQIREATVDDHDFIVDCNCRMAMETERLALDRGTVGRGVAAVLGDAGKGRYFVALSERRPVGQLMITYEWSDWRDGNLWWIQSVYVAPEFRRQGAFAALYRHVSGLARASGAAALRLYVEQHNDAAQQTYRRLGMRLAPYRVMEQPLRGDGRCE